MLTEKSRTGHVVVLGAGVMGSGIAALMANLGWRVSLLDRVPEGAGTGDKERSVLADSGLARALRAKPPAFALPEYGSRVTTGNVEDHLDWLADADWVVEAASEDPATKQALMAAVAEHAGPHTVVSSNTSALPSGVVTAGCPPELRRRYLGTHFFNPPRYMRPIELIASPATDPAVFEGFVRFADRVLGKRVIRAHDTPGFISTRFGLYALARAIELAVRHGLTVEEADYLTGPLIGRPKSGTFRLADVVGIDLLARIVDYLAGALPDDPGYGCLCLPDAMRRLVDEGRVGAKADAGFYRREPGGGILSLDLSSLEYRPRREPDRLPDEVTRLPLPERLRALWSLPDQPYGACLRELLTDSLGYIAQASPEAADSIEDVDAALTGGFGWEMGPFETLDALGPIAWPRGEPHLVARLHSAGRHSFYEREPDRRLAFNYHARRMMPIARPADHISLEDLESAGRTILHRDEARLLDLGQGVACLAWRTRLGTLNPGLVEALVAARDRAAQDFAAMVLAGAGADFSAGYDLRWLLARIEAGEWDTIDAALRAVQQLALSLERCSVPVAGAPAGYALGGGCELLLRCAAVQTVAEAYIGLPETAAGLLPAGGGLPAVLGRALEALPPGPGGDPFAALLPAWNTIRTGRRSTSADEARALGFLRPRDGVTVNPDRLLYDARARALLLAGSWRPEPPRRLLALGEEGLARFRWELHLLRRSGQASEHDARLADRLAWVLCGGDLVHPAEVSEDYLLDLEREAFLSVAGCPETLARIRHLLDTGTPLRN